MAALLFTLFAPLTSDSPGSNESSMRPTRSWTTSVSLLSRWCPTWGPLRRSFTTSQPSWADRARDPSTSGHVADPRLLITDPIGTHRCDSDRIEHVEPVLLTAWFIFVPVAAK